LDGAQRSCESIMEHYRANGSRPRAKLLGSVPKFEKRGKEKKRMGANSTRSRQHPNDDSHGAMLGCWDSLGTLFLMSTLVLIGKLVRMLNGASEWVAGLLPEGLGDCWAEAQDKEVTVRQKKRDQIGNKREVTRPTYPKRTLCEVCLKGVYPLVQYPFSIRREASEVEASLYEGPYNNQSVRYSEKKRGLTCADEDQCRQVNPPSPREIFESVPSRRTTREPERKTDSYLEYGSDVEDLEMEQGQLYEEAQGSRRNLPGGPSVGISAPIPAATSIIRLPMPLPGSPGVPLFEGANATEFLDNFDDLCDEYAVTEQGRLVKLPKYCSRSIGDSIKSQKAWVEKDYPALRKAILWEYRMYDSHQQMYSTEFLERYKSIKRTEKDDILQYCRKYHMIATFLFEKGAPNKYQAGVWFLHGLPQSVRANVMRKYKIISTEPLTVNYDQIVAHVEETTASEQAIKDIERESNSSRDRTGDEMGQLVERLHSGCEVPKEKRLTEPIVPQRSGAAPEQASEKVIQTLTDSMKQLSIGIMSMVQSGNSVQIPRNTQSQSRRNSSTQGAAAQRSGVTPETSVEFDKPPPGAFAEGSLRTAATVGALNTNRIGEGVCFYCHNREPGFPPHKFRNQCPWYKYHLMQGTIHLNKANRLCLGPEREGAPEIFLTRETPHGAQVRMRTAGTEFDENINDRPKEQTVSGPSTAVQGLTFIAEESSSSDEELEGFGIVKERNITEANASRIESPPPSTKEKWVNPTKILKRKAEKEKEKTYAVGKGLRLGSWEPAQVSKPEEEPDQFDIELPDAPPEEKKKEKALERAKPTRKVTPRKKYMDVLKEEQDPEALLKEIMDT
jgi:hypothetical protein